MSAFERWESFWFSKRADVGRRLSLVRLLLGLAALLKLTGLYGCVQRSVIGSIDVGLPRHTFSRGRFGFDDMPAPLFDAIPRLSLEQYRMLENIGLVLALLLFVGLAARLAGALLGASFVWMVTFDIGAFKHNTFTLGLACLLIALTPCTDALSLDARIKRRLARPPPAERSVLPVRLLQVWVCAIYTFATLAKVNESWWGGRFFEMVVDERRVHMSPQFLSIAGAHAVHVVLGVCTLLLEGLLSFGLLVPRTRRIALLLGVLFHVTLELTTDVGAYSYTMFALYALFLERADGDALVDLARRARARLIGPRAPAAS